MLRALSSFTRRMRRFRRDERGVTTIEFVMILPPFLMLTSGTLEVALIQLTNSQLSNALTDISRPIYTGSADCSLTVDDYKEAICNRMTLRAYDKCLEETKIVLDTLDGGFSAPDYQAWDDITEVTNPGGSTDVMMMMVYHRWKVMLPMMDRAIGGDDGYVLLGQSTAFRNEPFGDNGGCS